MINYVECDSFRSVMLVATKLIATASATAATAATATVVVVLVVGVII